ncbi:CST complex subunit STN1-like [Phragmites australis]|uniref:CST complex subunit STN1-like n=1 Tax=Phragmites australis TaxID=29695 RepID=UPI002D78EB36|nr:CST complex subunit STN1-like [Phragmites australis]
MDSLHLVHIKILAADLLSLTVRHTSPPSFLRCGRTVARAELVGVVVSCDRRDKFLRFLVDDGTGCVPCVLWLNHQYLNANNSSRALESDPTAEMALKMSEEVRLGTLLRVRGRIVMYRGAIQIAVRDVVLEKDPNVEVLHWLQCVRMAKECYDLPLHSAGRAS